MACHLAVQRTRACKSPNFCGVLSSKILVVISFSWIMIVSLCQSAEDYVLYLFGRCLEDCPHADVCFLIHGESVHAHRMILSARSSYFAHKFTRKWRDRPVIEIKHRLVRREEEGTF